MTTYYKFCLFKNGSVCICVFVCMCRKSQRTWVTAPTPPSFLLRTLHQSQKLKLTAPPQITSLSTTPGCPGTTLSHLISSSHLFLSVSILPSLALLPSFSSHNTLFILYLYLHHLSPCRAVDNSSKAVKFILRLLSSYHLHPSSFFILLSSPSLESLSSLSSFHSLSFLCFLLWSPSPSPVY